MNKTKKSIITLFSAVALGSFIALPTSAYAQKGGISAAQLERFEKAYPHNSTEKALQNIVVTHGLSFENSSKDELENLSFSNQVPSQGITDQKNSGRCWLFTGLNVLRSEAMLKHNLGEFYFSQNYNFFWDQLEKSNLFLQAVIDTRKKPMTDRTVEWLFRHPIGDGGQFTGVSDNIMKYGVVPSDVMPETASSNNTGKLSTMLARMLRQTGIRMREAAEKGASEAQLLSMKEKTLTSVYRLLVLTLGEPTKSFTYTLKDKNGKAISTKTYTPQSFYKELFGNRDLRNEYVMVMNNPTLPYYKMYAIEFDRHMYDGKNWTYINVPMEDLKAMAIASIKDNEMLYYSCDVGKQLDRETGILAMDNYDYSSITDFDMNMDKRERIATGDSGSTHAMTLMAVDLDANGKPIKWMVENSWGPNAGYKGHLVMTDEWFDAYTFRIVVNKKYLNDKQRACLKEKAELLPPWDPMFLMDK